MAVRGNIAVDKVNFKGGTVVGSVSADGELVQ